MLHIHDAHEGPRLEAVRDLFNEYATAFDYHLCFDGFQEELEGLPGAYAPPTGGLLLAELDDRPIGCVALRRVDANVCELKRLYVRPAYRGLAAGRTLAEHALVRARAMGYARMILDTLPEMERARALYAALGFQAAPPLPAQVGKGSLVMARDLSSA